MDRKESQAREFCARFQLLDEEEKARLACLIQNMLVPGDSAPPPETPSGPAA